MFQKLDEVEKRYDEITKKISDPEVIAQQSQWQTFMKEHAEIEPVVLKYREYKKAKQAIEDAKEMLKDPEMKELAEIEIEENKEYLKNNEITTIYIGGGTPSSIKEEHIKEILEKIFEVANIKNKEKLEITIEVNPGTVTKEKLQMFKNCGINRLSIGLQSAQNRLLKEIGRIHTLKEFLETYKIAKEVKFDNINVDLMIGLPKQSIQDIKKSLELLIKLDPTHISVYSLIVEEGTIIEKKIEEGSLVLPEEDLERIFERFYRVDKARTREMGGTGLGLSIAKEILDRNNGTIDIKSKLNEGTEVVIRIPTKTNNKFILKEEENLNEGEARRQPNIQEQKDN